jgi:dienelactone hydrolase|nr:hypothetical protein [uncultured Limnohabitans sp.]
MTQTWMIQIKIIKHSRSDMNIKNQLLSIALLLVTTVSTAQNHISYAYKTLNGTTENLDAVISRAPTEGKKPAVVILHHSGGWDAGTNKQYVELLTRNGFITVEPIMFRRPTKTTYGESLAKAMGAINFLSTQPDVDMGHVSIIGTSYGANLSVFMATQWASEKFLSVPIKISKVAALYPVCWFYPKLIKRDTNSWFFKERLQDFPEGFMDHWTNTPMKLFAAGQDDYNDKDAAACTSFKEALTSETQKALTSVVVYPEATHGWDQGRTFSFHEPAACQSKGCTNTNAFNPAVTAQAKKELLNFLTAD